MHAHAVCVYVVPIQKCTITKYGECESERNIYDESQLIDKS